MRPVVLVVASDEIVGAGYDAVLAPLCDVVRAANSSSALLELPRVQSLLLAAIVHEDLQRERGRDVAGKLRELL